MKKYLLLASVAGCLMANNAMANDQSGISGTLTVSASIASVYDWRMNDVEFGNIVLAPAAGDNDVIATFTNGNISYTEGKTIAHGSASTGCIGLSSLADMVTGVSFSATSVDLKDDNNVTIAQVTNLGVGTKTTVSQNCSRGGGEEQGYYINGQLVIKDTEFATGKELTGTTTVTLQF